MSPFAPTKEILVEFTLTVSSVTSVTAYTAPLGVTIESPTATPSGAILATASAPSSGSAVALLVLTPVGPTSPLSPFSPVAPVSPLGNTISNTASVSVPEFVTDASSPLVTEPTVTVAAFPGIP